MTELEIIAEQARVIKILASDNKKLTKKVKELKVRLTEKREFEAGYLRYAGSTPQLISKIRAKDDVALAD